MTLDMLPPTDKAELTARFDNWFTDRRVTRRIAETYREQGRNGLLLDTYTVITTSGNTGKPPIMVRDPFHNTVHGAGCRFG